MSARSFWIGARWEDHDLGLLRPEIIGISDGIVPAPTGSTMVGRWLLGLVAVGSFAVACAEPPPVKKKAAIACDPATTDCSSMTSGPRKEHSDGSLKTTTGSPLEAPDTPASQEAKKAKDAKTPTDATPTPTTPTAGDDEPASGTGTDTVPLPPPRPADAPSGDPSDSSSSSGTDSSTDPLAGVGPQCTKLWECCANLRAAGITGSADQCDDSALGNDELTCEIADENYKTPDDNYDPVCF
jgi:hypothetical protein